MFSYACEGTCGICNSMKNGTPSMGYIVEMLTSYITPNSTIIDAGANIGATSYPLAEALSSKGGGKLISIEANANLIPHLKLNTENRFSNVEVNVINACVMNECGTVKFPEPDVRHGESLFNSCGSFGMKTGPTTGQFFEIPGITLDSLQAENVSVIKIDIEGYDILGLRGCTELIKKYSPAIVFEFGAGSVEEGTWQDYEEFIKSVGYEIKVRTQSDYLIVKEK